MRLSVAVRLVHLTAAILCAAASQALEPPALTAPEPGPPAISAYSSYNALRQGTAMQVAVVAAPTQQSQWEIPPALLSRGTDSSQMSIAPTSLELQPDEGLIVSTVTAPTAHPAQFGDRPAEVLDRTSPFRFLVIASPTTPPGEYRVHAKLRYRVVSNQLVTAPRELRFYIPVKVVDVRVPVQLVRNPYVRVNRSTQAASRPGRDGHPVRDTALAAPILILTAPLWMVYGIICHAASNCTD
jgi:hypothetical protein